MLSCHYYYYPIISFLNLHCSAIFKCEHISNLERKLMRNCNFLFLFFFAVEFHFTFYIYLTVKPNRVVASKFSHLYKGPIGTKWDVTVEQGDTPIFLTSTHYNRALHRTQRRLPCLWNKPRITRKTKQLVMNPLLF